jgi:hypothetical protein
MAESVLIDSVVRQTTVLLASLATAAGSRASLSGIANEVLASLVTELKAQGVGNKVIADMLGMALRTYHDRVGRLGESQSDAGRSLWDAVRAHIQERGPIRRNEVLSRFARDDEGMVKGVLRDLVRSGLVSKSGQGDATVYRLTTADEKGLRLASDVVGDPARWEAAVLDHYRSVVTAIRAQLTSGSALASFGDAIGGSTFHLDVWPGHAFEPEAVGLLASLRRQAVSLREAIERHNESHRRPDHAREVRVVVYVGQNVITEENADSD